MERGVKKDRVKISDIEKEKFVRVETLIIYKIIIFKNNNNEGGGMVHTRSLRDILLPLRSPS